MHSKWNRHFWLKFGKGPNSVWTNQKSLILIFACNKKFRKGLFTHFLDMTSSSQVGSLEEGKDIIREVAVFAIKVPTCVEYLQLLVFEVNQ